MPVTRRYVETNSLAVFWWARINRIIALWSLLVTAVAAQMPAQIALPGDRAFPESITATRAGIIYVGSLGAGGVARVLPGSTAKPWIEPGAFGTASILGVLADEKSNTLWLCSNDMSSLGVRIPGGGSGSFLKGFDLKSGAGKVSAALPNKPALCNDMAIGVDGSVYVTNSLTPEILRLPPDGEQLEVWFTDPELQPPAPDTGLDGLAFGADGNLYVDRYQPGDLFRIKVVNGKPSGLRRLHTSRPLVLTDGLRRVHGNEFLLVEGGGRVDLIVIHGDEVTVRTLRDGFDVPTGVAPIGHVAWVSEGQLSLLFDPSKKGQRPRLPFKIYSVAFGG